jgi:acylphosphatase
MPDEAMRVRVRVRGRVQGVSFRATTRHEATRLGLVGWVANERDGSVVLEAQGPAARVEALLGWCRQGPALAAVVAVDVEDQAPVAGERGFEIRF